MSPGKPTPTPRLTLCLAIDLKESTASGLRLNTKKLDRFNLALVNQLKPHLEAVQLDDAVVKFTGDGWLVMSDDQEHAPALCCLALVMAHRFAGDIFSETGLEPDCIPALRLAVAAGRDLPVQLHTGQRDFVGSSVRRTVRASQFCEDNEVLVDEFVRGWVAQDFVTERVEMEPRRAANPSAKWEEDLVLHRLSELKREAVDDDAPMCYVNTLTLIGRRSEAESLAERISDRLMHESRLAGADPEEMLQQFNELIASAKELGTANIILSDMTKAGVRPSLQTYHLLLEKAPNADVESKWLHVMQLAGLAPTADTYDLLIRRAPNEDVLQQRLEQMVEAAVRPHQATVDRLIAQAPDVRSAAVWFNRLRETGVQPGKAAFEALIEKSETFGQARYWLERLIEAGYEVQEDSLVELFSKGVAGVAGDELLEWYLALPYHPAHPIKRAITDYRKAGRVADALRLCLDYPQVDAAVKTIRQHPNEAIRYFEGIVEREPDHPNGAYALALALEALGRVADAQPWLRRAHDLASPGPRKDELARKIRDAGSCA